jgi:hypothetical protein
MALSTLSTPLSRTHTRAEDVAATRFAVSSRLARPAVASIGAFPSPCCIVPCRYCRGTGLRQLQTSTQSQASLAVRNDDDYALARKGSESLSLEQPRNGAEYVLATADKVGLIPFPG